MLPVFKSGFVENVKIILQLLSFFAFNPCHNVNRRKNDSRGREDFRIFEC